MDRISTITEGENTIVNYTYADQNNGKFSKTLRNVIQEDVTLDAVYRPANITHKELGSNTEISNRTLDWTKTDLKTSELNADGTGETNAYDTAKRLREQADTEKNTGSEYDIDGVDNVTVKKETKKGITSTTSVKVNERNQLTELNGIPVIHDNNGNLTSYKNQYTYDWKNQLIKVVTPDGKTIEYKYDALGRRVQKKVTKTGAVTKITNFVWDGWRVIEEYDGDGQLTSRYVYGNALDERVEIEKDNNTYIPLQDNIGSVFAIADTSGNIVERYSYSTYGTATFIHDNVPPQVDVVRIEAGNVFIRFSEPVNTDKAEAAVTIKQGVDVISGTFTFEDSDQFMKFTPSAALPQNETLTVTVAVTLEDRFKNTLAAEFNESFTYAGAPMIIYDRAAPVVEEVRVYEDNLYVTFNECLAPVSLINSIELQSPQGLITGTISYENSKILKFEPSIPLANGVEYTVMVTTAVQDLSGKALPEELTAQFTYKGTDLIIYEEPSEHEHDESLKQNTYLFQGRTYEPESGLYYYRHRYLHPELGRFLQQDPMGYHDSMNMYQAFNNNPINFVDPMGLFTKEERDQAFRIKNSDGLKAAQRWIDNNITGRDSRFQLHMQIRMFKYDPEKAEAERYETNTWTVFKDTLNGSLDTVNAPMYRLMYGSLHNDTGMMVSGAGEIALMGLSSVWGKWIAKGLSKGGGWILKKLAPKTAEKLSSWAEGQIAKYIANKAANTPLMRDNVLPFDKLNAKTGGPISAEAANAPHIARGNRPPYASGKSARDIALQEEKIFVRVHGEGNKARSWMMRPHEIEGLTPAQIKNKFALPEIPTYVSEVHVPAGTRIRVGVVGKQVGWGSGGGIQYELLERLSESAFKNTRRLQ